jgi:hypothetical protein
MTLEEAKQAIQDGSMPYARRVEASAVIAASKQSELSDLIRCLKLGGLAAETAATALYSRTGRPRGGPTFQLSVDADEWSRYLARQLEVASG